MGSNLRLCLCLQQFCYNLSDGRTMRKKRVGDRAKPTKQLRPGRGRPVIHKEAWAKVSVVLFERQIVDLDRLVTNVRRTRGLAMNRTEVIRALIDGLIGSGLDLTKHGSEATLRAHVAQCLSRAKVPEERRPLPSLAPATLGTAAPSLRRRSDPKNN